MDGNLSGDGASGSADDDGDDCWDWSQWGASDDVKGGDLCPKLVYLARKKELAILKERKVYEYRSIAEARQRTGRSPLRLKWIDTNKGDMLHPAIRSRLVCTEVRRRGVGGGVRSHSAIRIFEVLADDTE